MTTLVSIVTLAASASVVLAVVCRLAPMDRPRRGTAPSIVLHLALLALAAWIGSQALSGVVDAAHMILLSGCVAVLYAIRHEHRPQHAEIKR